MIKLTTFSVNFIHFCESWWEATCVSLKIGKNRLFCLFAIPFEASDRGTYQDYLGLELCTTGKASLK
jgi:hypothetical protein